MTASEASIPWGMVGWGAGGQVFHAPLVRSAAGLDLVAVVSTNPERAESARSEGLTVYPDLASMSRAGVRGVTITTPAGTHADLAVEALELGLHVVVDKPFATTAAEARRIIAAATADTVLTAYQNRRWDGDFLTLQSLVASGELGRVDRFESRIERFRPQLPRWSRDRASTLGGGTLVDLGPHLIDQAVACLGPVTAVFADLAVLGEDRVSDDDVLLLLRHGGGARTMIVASVHAAVQGPRFRVSGTNGGALIEGFDVQEEDLFAGESPASRGDGWGVEPVDRTVMVEIEGTPTRRPLHRGRWDTFYPAVAASIRENSPVPVDPADSVHVAAIFDAARLSSARGAWSDVASN